MIRCAACLTLSIATTVAALEPLPLMETVTVSGSGISVEKPPKGFVVDADAGLLMAGAVKAQVVHRTQTRVLETRATITPKGDYLLMFPEGDHYAKSKGEKINSMMACRSSDHGKTWSSPAVAYDLPYGQHGFVPLIPRGTQRIYCFGTQPVPGKWTWENGQRENAPIGYRWSDDDGHTWSETKLIAPANDPGFMGMSVMRMTETDAGTWLIGSHLADWSVKPFTTQQYLLRSEDKGETWTVLPGARPNGWAAEGFNRMDEGRPLNLGGGRVLFMSRTPQGHLFTAWSNDDGRTWTKPEPSTLVHPDAPPMLFQLSDGKTLVAFHHNKVPVTGNGELSDKADLMKMRSEVWASLSTDEGHTWSSPRVVLANAVAPNLKVSGFNSQCSYLDAFTEDGVLHLFMPHRWQQVLHLTLTEEALTHLPSQVFIKKLATAPKTEPKQPVYTTQISANVKPTRQLVYKKIGDRELGLDVFEPAGFKTSDQRACFVSIHGGGWTSGSPKSMHIFADHCAKLGMVSVCVQYRLYKPGTDVSVFECVKDVRAALRYVRAHAAELGIDPAKIIANGASAGGHLAAATAMFDGVDHGDEDLKVSCRPDALVLFSPVIDTSPDGYGNAKAGERWKELSPAHQVKAEMPPTLLFHGDGDTTTPIQGARLFVEAMRRAGNRIEFISPPGAIHTFMFKDKALYEDTLKRMDAFFDELGFAKVQVLRLPAVISDHMVLQANKPATIWGWANAGDTIKVEFSGQSKTSQANAKGEWQVKLDPMAASGEPRDLIVSSNHQAQIIRHQCSDVLVGEVWLASGQSNMEMQINGRMHGKVDNADAVIAEAKHPTLRLFVHDAPFAIYDLPVPPDEPLADRPGKWIVCSPETVADFTAMGYFVARDIMKAAHTPVGILSASVGGTPIEAWTGIEAQQRDPALKPLLDDWTRRLDGFDPAAEQSAFLEKKTAWLKQRAVALKANQPAPKAPSPFKNIGVMKPGRLFNGVIAPLVPYTLRGVIWYQGERNANGAFTGLYGAQMKTLITGWRAQWHDDFYFAWVQLPASSAPQKLPSEPTGWGVSVREGQMQALALPHTGMAITMDIGDPKQGHPTNKADFAARLSRVVLHDVYQQDIAIWSGPVFKSVEFKDGQARLSFHHGEGLKASSGALEGFAIAGDDQQFVWADAKVEGDQVITSHASIPSPKAVRYAWASNPKGNLVNAAELPASPFRTDAWGSPAKGPLFETQCIFPISPGNKPNYRIPSIIQAPNGDILVICEKRNDGIGDIGNHDIVMKRSTDRGQTWGEEQVILDDEDRVSTDITVGIDRDSKKLWLFFLRDKKKFAYLTSTDSGATWRGPVVIHEQVTRPAWDDLKGKAGDDRSTQGNAQVQDWERNWSQRYGCGPGNAMVQLRSGRLLVPARHREDVGGGRLRSFAHCFFSDDHGATWRLGGTIGLHTSECQFVELNDGSVRVISRNESSDDSPDNLRHLTAISRDGGATWTDLHRLEELITPRCHGSVERFDDHTLLFCSPASPFRQSEHPYGRYNLTVRVSHDEGASWSAGRTLWPHPGSYSDIAVLDDHSVAVVYERGDKGSTHYWDELHFVRCGIEWTESR